MWSLGCLIWEVFNGSFTKNTSLKSPGKVSYSLLYKFCSINSVYFGIIVKSLILCNFELI